MAFQLVFFRFFFEFHEKLAGACGQIFHGTPHLQHQGALTSENKVLVQKQYVCN